MKNIKKLVKSKNIIIAILVLLLTIVLGILIFRTIFSPIRKQMELGQKYLNDEEWEQAIASFDGVIDIDPKNTDAYINKAIACVELNDIERAITVLSEGYMATSNNEIKELIQEIAKENGIDIDVDDLVDGTLEDGTNAGINDTDSEAGDENSGDSYNPSADNSNSDSDSDSNNNQEANTDFEDLTIDKLEQLSVDITRAFNNYICGNIDNDRVKAICDYWIPLLEEEMSNEAIDTVICRNCLYQLYYMNCDFSACTNMLNELYNVTGQDVYNPGGTMNVSGEMSGTRTLNEYGLPVEEHYTVISDPTSGWSFTEDMTTIYTSDGKTAKYTMHNVYPDGGGTMDSEITYEYDSQGRMISKKDYTVMNDPYSGESTSTSVTTCTYSGNTISQVTNSEYSGTGRSDSSQMTATGVMDEFGATWDGWKYQY